MNVWQQIVGVALVIFAMAALVTVAFIWLTIWLRPVVSRWTDEDDFDEHVDDALAVAERDELEEMLLEGYMRSRPPSARAEQGGGADRA